MSGTYQFAYVFSTGADSSLGNNDGEVILQKAVGPFEISEATAPLDNIVVTGDEVSVSNLAALQTSGLISATSTVTQLFGSASADGTTGALVELFTTDGGLFDVYFTNTDFQVGDPFTVLVNGSTFTLCFAAGTLIVTPDGETTVETLQIGDLVTTADGRTVPVKWIGRQTLLKLFSGERARPVRVAAGALGDGLPHTDLVLTADHALILDGLAINAGALVNGTTITLEPLSALPDRVTYYHVETEEHDVILANGTPAETFIDYVGRQAFDNHAEYVSLYGDERIIAEMPLPRISTARLVPPALKARLAGRDVA